MKPDSIIAALTLEALTVIIVGCAILTVTGAGLWPLAIIAGIVAIVSAAALDV